MKLTRTQAIAGLCIALTATGALVIFSQRDGAGQGSKNVAAANAKSAKDRNAATDKSSMTLEQWTLKIEETSLGDFRSLMSAAMKISDPNLRNAVVTGIVDRWMLEDATDFIKYIAALEVNESEESLAILSLALQESLTKLSPERAASDEILVIVQRLIDYLAVNNPEMALVWAKKWLLDDTLENALVAIARGFAKTDIDKSLAVIDGMASPLRRSQALATVGAIWAMKDPKAALNWAMNLKLTSERGLTLNSVLLAVAQQDMDAAAQSLRDQANQMNEEYKRERAAELAKRGETARDELNDPNSEIPLPPPASPDTELMGDAAKNIGKGVAESNGGDEGIKLAESIEPDYLKLKTLSGALAGWATTDPQAALAYVKANYPANNDLIASVYNSWSLVDSRAAAEGVNMITDPAQRALALAEVVKVWSTKKDGDPFAAAAYLSEIPASEATDSTKAAVVNALAQKSPQEAWALASTITNESAQYRALKDAFANIVISNPSEANTLLTSTNLPKDTSDRLRDMLDAVVGN